jgi:iron complex outermembrane recepter protein
MLVKRRIGALGPLAFLNALLVTTALTAPAYAQIETVVVTAEKKAEDLQSVPIAVTAFTAEDLAAHQITDAEGLMFNVPSVNYTKTNFTSSSFQIRGIGSTATGVSADDGVAFNVNDVYLNSPMLAETEYYDIERLEILRGPQSTLYGRNATGGSSNIITAKPDTESFDDDVEAEYGNYNDEKFKAMVNIPIVDDKLALRIAGLYWNRGGTTDNLYNDTHIDSRNMYSARASLRFTPDSDTTIDVVASYSLEADTRMRSQKQYCDHDSSGVLGCLPDSLGTGTTNTNADFEQILASQQVIGTVYTQDVAPQLTPTQAAEYQGAATALAAHGLLPAGATPAQMFAALGLFNLTDGGVNLPNPANLHQVDVDFNPIYDSNETLIEGQLKHRFHDIDMTLLYGYQSAGNSSQQSYAGSVGETIGLTPTQRAIWSTLDPTVYNTYLSGAGLPVSGFDAGDAGIIGGDERETTTHNGGIDLSYFTTTQNSVELRFNSDFSSQLNFLVAGYYLTDRITNGYRIATPTLDYDGLLYGAMLSGFQPVAIGPSTYWNDTGLYTLESGAVFGELYEEAIPDTLKFTLGLRYTDDSKTTDSRTALLNAIVPLGTTNLDTPVPYISQTPLGSGLEGPTDFVQQSVHNTALTGRFVADYTPQLDFTDATLLYASFSRGYKAGGINPPLPVGSPPGTPQYFAPEYIDALELGSKNTLLGGTLQANADAWYYNYTGLQVASIVNKTAINQNINAILYGFEGEFLWAPNDQWQLNLSLSNTHSSIGNSAVVDTRDPTDGNPNVLLVKDLQGAYNCVISVVPGTPYSAAAQANLPNLVQIPRTVQGFANPAGYGSCSADANGHPTFLAGTPLAALAPVYIVSAGVPKNLKGNHFQNTPDWTISWGAQFTAPVGGGYTLVPRVDLYWQAGMFGTIFNDPIDKIAGYTVVNGQIQLNAPNSRWYARVFIDNAFDEQYITGMYVSDASTGLFTNAFTGQPRTFGIQLGAHI